MRFLQCASGLGPRLSCSKEEHVGSSAFSFKLHRRPLATRCHSASSSTGIDSDGVNAVQTQLEDLQNRVRAAEQVLAIHTKNSTVSSLEEVTLQPGFWDDQNKAQQIMAQISKHQEELQMVTAWKGTIDDICVALELHAEDDSVRPTSLTSRKGRQ